MTLRLDDAAHTHGESVTLMLDANGCNTCHVSGVPPIIFELQRKVLIYSKNSPSV